MADKHGTFCFYSKHFRKFIRTSYGSKSSYLFVNEDNPILIVQYCRDYEVQKFRARLSTMLKDSFKVYEKPMYQYVQVNGIWGNQILPNPYESNIKELELVYPNINFAKCKGNEFLKKIRIIMEDIVGIEIKADNGGQMDISTSHIPVGKLLTDKYSRLMN